MDKPTPKAAPPPVATPAAKDPMAGMDHSKMPGMKMPPETAKKPLPKTTEKPKG